jgi:hypothetical protein
VQQPEIASWQGGSDQCGSGTLHLLLKVVIRAGLESAKVFHWGWIAVVHVFLSFSPSGKT